MYPVFKYQNVVIYLVRSNANVPTLALNFVHFYAKKLKNISRLSATACCHALLLPIYAQDVFQTRPCISAATIVARDARSAMYMRTNARYRRARAGRGQRRGKLADCILYVRQCVTGGSRIRKTRE
jgi:hypothetical protein